MDEGEQLLFEAVLTPHRSLGRRPALAVALALTTLSVGLGSLLAVLGAWPVLGFSGLEIALAATLLVLHGRAGREREHVRLTAAALRVVCTDWRGRVRSREWPVGWLAVALEERAGAVPRLLLRRRGAEAEIARLLGEEEKRRFGAALGASLASLRSPRFDNEQLRDA